MIEHACIAATEFGGRCRHMAKAPSPYCEAPHVEGCQLAPAPDQILLKLRVNKSWRDTFSASGPKLVVRSDQKQAMINQKHIDHAEQFGRGAFVIRKDAPDSGTPVFGAEGARAVNLGRVMEEIGAAGFSLNNAHVLENKDKSGKSFSMFTLVLDFQIAAPGSDQSPSPLSPLGEKMVSELLSTDRWGFCHVWANPPKNESSLVVHTVNCSHREVGQNPTGFLAFVGGLWGIEP